MRSAISTFAFGVWLLQQQATLPDFAWEWLPVLFILTTLLPRRALWQRITRQTMLIVLACALGFFYAAWVAQQRLADSLPADWQGKDIAVIGVVAELPRQHADGLSFAFDLEKVLTPDAHVPPHVLLSTYDNEQDEPLPLHAGERWQLTLRLKQPHGSSNPHGFDFEAWMLENRLRASGYVRGNEESKRLDAMVYAPSYIIESMRENVRAHFQKVLGDAPYTGVLAALAIGDQSSIPAAQWQVFTRTGVNHLMRMRCA